MKVVLLNICAHCTAFMRMYSYHYIAFIYCFDLCIKGSGASEAVPDNEDVIDLKDEPVEVSYCIF